MSRARQRRRLARLQRPAPAWAPVPLEVKVAPVARPLDWTLYPGQARASLATEPASERTFDGVELGRMHQAAHDRHQLAWWLREIHPLPGVTLATLLARGRRLGLEHVVRAIVERAGLLPKGSEVAA
jgi:hypothetical protein